MLIGSSSRKCCGPEAQGWVRSINSLNASGLDGRTRPAVKSSSATAGSVMGLRFERYLLNYSLQAMEVYKTHFRLISEVSTLYSYNTGLSLESKFWFRGLQGHNKQRRHQGAEKETNVGCETIV